ncbi:unnamed protein product [Rotaria sp. Silwood2]|nr:unnamed protein product [Rotaria sp. Silwood2]CAF4122618.1 unnamed protein product [Rotaria sp. Silwood2]
MAQVLIMNDNRRTNGVEYSQLLINKENKESITLIWFDPNSNLREDTEQIARLRLIIDYIIIFINLEECISFIQSINKEKIFLITLGAEATQILSRISSFRQIDSIFIFSKETNRYEYLLNEYSKIIGIYTVFDDLCKSIKEQIDFVYKQIQTFSFFDQHKKLTKDLFKESAEFLWFQLFHYVIARLPRTQKEKQQMIKKCKQYYCGNTKEMKSIYEFEQNYESKDAIFWYSKQSFIYKLINKALRIQDIDLLYELRFFIVDFSRNLQREHENILLSKERFLHVYRGIKLNKQEYNKLKENRGKLISTNGYLTTTKRLSSAINMAQKPTKRVDVIPVLFHIQCDINQIDKNISFADIDQFNECSNKQEVLFDFNVCFKIESIQENELFQTITMSLSNKGQQITKDFIELRQKETEEQSILFIFGRLFCDLGEYNKSQNYFQKLLEDSNDEDHAWIEFNIGRALHLKGEWNEAKEYYYRAYDRMIQNKPARTKDSAHVLNNIGNILTNQRKYDEAFEHLQRTLKIKGKFYPSDHVDIAHVLNNIGNVLANQKKYDEALDYYQRALKMKEKLYQYDDIDIAISLSNIGHILFNLEQYDEALSYHLRALKIDEKFYPSDHVHIADSLNYIGICYENQKQLKMALDYYLRALEIYEKILPVEHPSRQTIEKHIFRLTRSN